MIANILETKRLSRGEWIFGICLLIGVEVLSNDHTPCGWDIALHQHTLQFEAFCLEFWFLLFHYNEAQRTFFMKSKCMWTWVYSIQNLAWLCTTNSLCYLSFWPTPTSWWLWSFLAVSSHLNWFIWDAISTQLCACIVHAKAKIFLGME
jgi:hypothetical protein